MFVGELWTHEYHPQLYVFLLSHVCLSILERERKTNSFYKVFPEMRAQLRTYHSIPSLQAHQDPNAYKQLQDAPRLKSILKGASEDVDQPNTLEKIKEESVPRTNPVNLIFVLAQFAPKVSDLHFFQPRDFFDLVMRSTLSSQSRARAFLWLMWWYLESDFSREAALNNPFGRGQEGEGSEGLPIKVPDFDSLTEEQANDENIDSPSELEFGEIKRLERKRMCYHQHHPSPSRLHYRHYHHYRGGYHHDPGKRTKLIPMLGILEEDEPLPRVNKRSKKGDYYDDDQASGDLSGMCDSYHPPNQPFFFFFYLRLLYSPGIKVEVTDSVLGVGTLAYQPHFIHPPDAQTTRTKISSPLVNPCRRDRNVPNVILR